jgi:phenylalanyl-tRNA synthetase beta chain
MLDAVAANLRYTDRVAVFEVGPVFHALGSGLPSELRRVGIALSGPAAARTWRGGDARALDFYDAKGAVMALAQSLGVALSWSNGSHPSMHPARTAEITSRGEVVGHVGDLHPMVAERWGVQDASVVVADLDLDTLQGLLGGPAVFQPFSAYPAVARDLCVIVGDDVPAQSVADVIRKTGGKLLVDVALFDVYRGSQIGGGRKSLAWSLTFQAPDKTLAGDVADSQRDRIAQAVVEELGAEIR